MTAQALLAALEQAGLTGRGGAGFAPRPRCVRPSISAPRSS